MSIFRDSNGVEWRVQFDAFSLAEAKKETGIDLADLSASGWQAIETDATAVGRVLAIVCGDEIRAHKMTARAFSRQVRGEVIEAGRKALRDEGGDFFPPNEWSAIRLNLDRRRTMTIQTEAMRMGVTATEMKEMTEAISKLPESVLLALVKSGGDTSSLLGQDNGSAAGPTATPSPVVTGSPVSAELPPAA